MSFLALALLSACSGNTELTEEIPEIVEEPVSYEIRCLTNPDCDPTETKAALLDYVGAVYDRSDRVRLDLHLTPDEKEFVTDTFLQEDLVPILNDPERKFEPYDLHKLFSQARRHFVTSLGTQVAPLSKDCDMVERAVYNDSKLQAVSLQGSHGCLHEYGGVFTMSGDELSVAAHSEDWLFALEGDNDVEAEFKLFDRIASVMGIPRFNPVVPVTDRVMTQTAAERFGRDEMDYLVAIAYGLFSSIIKTYGQTFLDQGYTGYAAIDRAHQLTMKMITEKIKIDKKEKSELESAFLIFCGANSDMSEMEEIWKAHESKVDDLIAETNLRTAELVSLSNELSIVHTRGQIMKKRDTTKTKTLFVIGSKHADIVKAVYDGVTLEETEQTQSK